MICSFCLFCVHLCVFIAVLCVSSLLFGCLCNHFRVSSFESNLLWAISSSLWLFCVYLLSLCRLFVQPLRLFYKSVEVFLSLCGASLVLLIKTAFFSLFYLYLCLCICVYIKSNLVLSRWRQTTRWFGFSSIVVKQNDYTYLAEITFNELVIKFVPCS